MKPASSMGNTTVKMRSIVFIFEKLILVCAKKDKQWKTLEIYKFYEIFLKYWGDISTSIPRTSNFEGDRPPLSPLSLRRCTVSSYQTLYNILLQETWYHCVCSAPPGERRGRQNSDIRRMWKKPLFSDSHRIPAKYRRACYYMNFGGLCDRWSHN